MVTVAPSGTDGASCGAPGSPCKTIKQGLAVTAASSTKNTVVVAAANYAEDGLVVPAGVTLQGGWTYESQWQHLCTADALTKTIVRPATDNATFRLVDLGGTARIETLSIQSRSSAAKTGESLYGVFATGATTKVVLDHVSITLANAGGGSNGSTGSGGGNPVSICTPAGGTNGQNGSAGGGAPKGSYTAAGYQPASGASGGTATAGQNGTPGGAHTCQPCSVPKGSPCGCGSSIADSCGQDGKPGCGGGPGGPGGPGTGGGSAIGVFLWDADLTILDSSVKSGNGGKGGSGASGGTGATGSAGALGNLGFECLYCSMTPPPTPICVGAPHQGSGGTPGGKGGTGGTGGPGGGGAGGDSYAVYKGGSASATVTTTTLTPGSAGPAGGGTKPGAAGTAAAQN